MSLSCVTKKVLEDYDQRSRQYIKATAAKFDMHLSVAGIWLCRSNEGEKKCI
jgi:hypothetical protein